jgi:FKBP-type peptidyl-prolyl cis-trans isomerase SlyD
MEEKQNKLITLNYQLYQVENCEKTLLEQTDTQHPFQFISGFGTTLDALEQHVVDIETGQDFELQLTPEQAFGPHDEECVHKVKREIFEVNGKFDSEHIFEGAVITLNDVEGHQFMARVTKVEADGVTVDTNHPYAGMTLCFNGHIVENRPATDEEVKMLIKHMTGGCSGCSGCGGEGGCHEGGCEEGKCGEGGCGGCH